MNVTMAVCPDSPEVLWNAFRLANMMLEGVEDVSIFLSGPSVRYAEMHSETDPLLELARIFILSEGQLLA